MLDRLRRTEVDRSRDTATRAPAGVGARLHFSSASRAIRHRGERRSRRQICGDPTPGSRRDFSTGVSRQSMATNRRTGIRLPRGISECRFDDSARGRGITPDRWHASSRFKFTRSTPEAGSGAGRCRHGTWGVRTRLVRLAVEKMSWLSVPTEGS